MRRRIFKLNYRLPMKLHEGNVFTSVCLQVSGVKGEYP